MGFSCSLMTHDSLGCVRSLWPAPALLCDQPVAAASSHDQYLGFHTMSKSTLEGYEMFCAHSWWIFWCYCCYVWPDAMCTFPYKLLFLLKPELSNLLLSQEETPSNTRLIPSKGWAVAEKALPGHKHTHRHTWSHHASELSQPMLQDDTSPSWLTVWCWTTAQLQHSSPTLYPLLPQGIQSPLQCFPQSLLLGRGTGVYSQMGAQAVSQIGPWWN